MKKSYFEVICILLVSVLLPILFACGGSDDGSIDKRYYDVPLANIVIDGNPDDWSGITPALTDPQGDSYSSYTGTDVKSLYIAQSTDLSKVYLMMELWDGPPNPDFASSYTTDGDAEHPNVPQSYSVFFADDCSFNGWPWPCVSIGALYDAVNTEWIYEILRMLTGTPEVIPGDTIEADTVIEWEFPINLLKSPYESVDFKGEVTSSAYPSVPGQTGGRDTIWEFNDANRVLVVRFNI
jgi:hypothetical protein